MTLKRTIKRREQRKRAKRLAAMRRPSPLIVPDWIVRETLLQLSVSFTPPLSCRIKE